MFSEEAANMFERATSTLLTKNMLLYFAYADYEEGRLKYEKVHQIYQKYLDIKDIDPTLVGLKKKRNRVSAILNFYFLGVCAIYEICQTRGGHKVGQERF